MWTDQWRSWPGTRQAGLGDPGVGSSWLWGLQIQDRVLAGWTPAETGRLALRPRPLAVSARGEGPGSHGISYMGSNPIRMVCPLETQSPPTGPCSSKCSFLTE